MSLQTISSSVLLHWLQSECSPQMPLYFRSRPNPMWLQPVVRCMIRFSLSFTAVGPSSLDLLQGKLPSSSTGNFTQELSAGPVALTDGSR